MIALPLQKVNPLLQKLYLVVFDVEGIVLLFEHHLELALVLFNQLV